MFRQFQIMGLLLTGLVVCGLLVAWGTAAGEPLVLSEAEQLTLRGWARRRTTAQGLAKRARIVLACADGLSYRGGGAPGHRPGHGGSVAEQVLA